MLSDRSRPFWATNFALHYFGQPREHLQRVVGINGRLWMCRQYEAIGEQVYHAPEFVLRQEWIYDRLRANPRVMFHKVPPVFWERCLTPTGTLLDFGCGTAESARAPWIDQGRQTILMDLDGPNFRYTRTKYPGSNVECRPVGSPLPEGYEGLLLLDVLEHVHDPLALWASLWDRLTPGGVAAVWFDTSIAPGHHEDSIAQRGAWVDRVTRQSAWVRWQNGCDMIAKPDAKKWWWPW